MKNLLYALAALPLLLLGSCSDDNDLPDVNINVDMTGLYESQGDLYLVSGDNVTINSISVTSLNGKPATLGRVDMFWNDVLQSSSIVEPYSITFNTENLRPGISLLTLQMGVYQEDKTASWAVLQYDIHVVLSQSELPPDAKPIGPIEGLVTPSETPKIQ